MSTNINIKTDSRALKYAENAAKDLKGAIDGGLDKAMSKVLDLVKSTADPALGILVGQLNSETSAGRVALMSSLMDLVQSDGVQTGLTLINTVLNDALILIAKIVTKIAEAQDAFGALDNTIERTRIRIDSQSVHTGSGGLTDNGENKNPPPSGEIVPSIGTLTPPAPPEYEWWNPMGWAKALADWWRSL